MDKLQAKVFSLVDVDKAYGTDLEMEVSSITFKKRTFSIRDSWDSLVNSARQLQFVGLWFGNLKLFSGDQ